MSEQADRSSFVDDQDMLKGENAYANDRYSDIELFETTVDAELEVDSEKIFFNTDKSETINFSPAIDDDQFEERKQAISALLDECMKPLIQRIEEQTEMLLEKEQEIREINTQLRLLPDLKSQVRKTDTELKLKHFENAALKKQIILVEDDKKKARNLTKLSNEIIRKIETKAQVLEDELNILKLENQELEETNEELFELKNDYEELKEKNANLEAQCRPWWQKLFS